MMKNRMASLSNSTAIKENDDTGAMMTNKKLKSPKKSTKTTTTTTAINFDNNCMLTPKSSTSSSKKEKSSKLLRGDDSMSSLTSKNKKDKSILLSPSKSKMESNSKKQSSTGNSSVSTLSRGRNAMDALHASYGSIGNGSFASIGYTDDTSYNTINENENDDDDEMDQFMTPRQCLTPPSASLRSMKHKQVGTSEREQIMAPESPTRPVPLKKHRVVAILEPGTKTKKKSSNSSSTKRQSSTTMMDMNQSCPALSFNDAIASPRSWNTRNNQSKKVAIPNQKDPTRVKTTFLEDCSDSSDSDHEKERKRLKKEKKKREQERAIQAQQQAAEQAAVVQKVSHPKPRRRSSIGPTVVPVLAPPAVSHGTNRSTSIRQRQPHKSALSTSSSTDAIYCKYHHQVATKMTSVVRGHLERMRYRIWKLQRQLETVSRRTDDDIAEIYVELEISKQEWEQRAQERFQRNVQRSDKTLNVHEAQALIHAIRNENTDFRERNAQLLSDVQKLRINNERLEHATKESEDFMSRLLYHQEIVELEHTKLVKVHAQYESTVKKHEDHLNLHVAHGECENRGRRLYGTVLGHILDGLDTYRHRDEQLVCDAYEMVQALESEYGKIERDAIDENTRGKSTNSDSKKEKKSKKTKKRDV